MNVQHTGDFCPRLIGVKMWICFLIESDHIQLFAVSQVPSFPLMWSGSCHDGLPYALKSFSTFKWNLNPKKMWPVFMRPPTGAGSANGEFKNFAWAFVHFCTRGISFIRRLVAVKPIKCKRKRKDCWLLSLILGLSNADPLGWCPTRAVSVFDDQEMSCLYFLGP